MEDCKSECKGIPERVAKLEVKINDYDKKWDTQFEKNDVLTKLSALMEMQIEESKQREKRQELRDEKQNKQMEKITLTLDKVNSNLSNLNTNQEKLNLNQQQLGERVSEIETTISNQKMDVVQIMKKVLIWGVIAGLSGLATYFGFR